MHTVVIVRLSWTQGCAARALLAQGRACRISNSCESRRCSTFVRSGRAQPARPRICSHEPTLHLSRPPCGGLLALWWWQTRVDQADEGSRRLPQGPTAHHVGCRKSTREMHPAAEGRVPGSEGQEAPAGIIDAPRLAPRESSGFAALGGVLECPPIPHARKACLAWLHPPRPSCGLLDWRYPFPYNLSFHSAVTRLCSGQRGPCAALNCSPACLPCGLLAQARVWRQAACRVRRIF